MNENKNITIYSKLNDFSYEWKNLVFQNDKFNYTFMFAKSYENHNWALQNTDILIIDDERYAPDIELIIKRFKARNIPILYFTNNKYITDKYLIETSKKEEKDIDKKNFIISTQKTAYMSDCILTQIPEKMKQLDKPKIKIRIDSLIPEKIFQKYENIQKNKQKKDKDTIIIFSNKKNYKDFINTIAEKYKKLGIRVINANDHKLENQSMSKVYACVYDLKKDINYLNDTIFAPILNGIPIISSDNNLKTFYKKSSGIIFAKDKKDIIKNLDKIINDSKYTESIVKTSFEYIKKKYSAKKYSEQFENKIEKFYSDWILKVKKPSKRALNINFAQEMKSNNRKKRIEIFPYLRPPKWIFQKNLILTNPDYKDYILKMDYKDLKKAYNESNKNKKPTILQKYTKDLLKKSCSPRICKMINNICKNPEYTLEEILFYMIKEVPRNHKIFKNETILQKYVKEFCDLSYATDKNKNIIFQYMEYNNQNNTIYSQPDTYNIRAFLTTAFKNEKIYKILYQLLELCKQSLINKNELFYAVYLLKSGYINPELVEIVIHKKYIKDSRLVFKCLKENDIKNLKNCKTKKIQNFLKLEKNIKYKPEHFFINIQGYGKNQEWGKNVSALSEHVSYMIKDKIDFIDVLSEICFYTRQNAMLTKRDKGDLKTSAILRYISPDNYTGALVTKYDYKSRYGGRYSKLFRKFKDTKVKLHSPHRDLMLTRITVNKNDNLAGIMNHVPSVYTERAIFYSSEIYKKLMKIIDKNMNKNNLDKVIKYIAEIHWIIAHNAPWGRGSDSIANIFIKGLLRAFEIKIGPIKKHISLDLEAFCTELKDYQENYPKYYTKFSNINMQ